MKPFTLFASSSLVLSFFALQGCAAQTDGATDPNAGGDAAEQDVKSGGNVSAANAKLLMGLLQAANAPSSTSAGVVGVGSRVARIHLTTAQGGIAKFISEGGALSTLDGAALGDVATLGTDWSALSKALVAGGAKWQTTAGENGASSGTLFAKVECKQVVSPTAKPSCTVSPIALTAVDAETLFQVLENVDAPSDTPKGLLGVGSRIATFTLTTAQGGTAHFISEGLSVETTGGKTLGDLGKAGAAWADVRTALLDGASVWKTTNGPHGSSSSTIVATVECKTVIAPSAKPTCSVF